MTRLSSFGILRVLGLFMIVVNCGCARTPGREELLKDVDADFQDISAALRSYADKHNRLPPTLADLPGGINPPADWLAVDKGCLRHYGYAVSEDGHVALLVSVGIDGVPQTADDYVKIIDIRPASAGTIEDGLRNTLLRSAYTSWRCVALDQSKK
jgi:hypothetical protein